MLPQIARLVWEKQAASVRYSRGLIVPSEGMRDVLQRCYPSCPPIHVLPWGTWDNGSPREAPGSLRAEFGIPRDAHVLLTLSRISPEKGQDLLSRCADRLGAPRRPTSPLWVFICGDAAFMQGPALSGKTAQAGGAPEAHASDFSRPRDRRTQARIFRPGRSVRLPVAPRKLRPDAAGSARGRIAGRVPGSSRRARDHARRIWRTGQSSQLSNAISRLLAEPSQLRVMSEAARAFAARRKVLRASRDSGGYPQITDGIRTLAGRGSSHGVGARNAGIPPDGRSRHRDHGPVPARGFSPDAGPSSSSAKLFCGILRLARRREPLPGLATATKATHDTCVSALAAV